jgi:hypothetical protein
MFARPRPSTRSPPIWTPDLVRDRRETIGLDRGMVLDPQPQQVADRRCGLARRKLESRRTLDSPWPGITTSASGGSTIAPLVPNPVLPTTTGSDPPSTRTTRSARPDGAGDVTSGSVRVRSRAIRRSSLRSRGRRRAKDRQPTRHRYRAAFSM